MKPWIGHALVWTGLAGFVALVGEALGRTQPIEGGLVLYVWLVLLLYVIAVFASGCAPRRTTEYGDQARMDDEAKALAERHFGGVPRDGCTAGTADRDRQPDHGS